MKEIQTKSCNIIVVDNQGVISLLIKNRTMKDVINHISDLFDNNPVKLPEDEKQCKKVKNKSSFYNNNGRLIKMSIDKICYLKASGSYCELHFVDGTSREIVSPMAKIIESINKENFVRVHNSYTINLQYLKEINGNKIMMEDGSKIQIGREYKSHFFTQINILDSSSKKYQS